jgi:hypothetical protein
LLAPAANPRRNRLGMAARDRLVLPEGLAQRAGLTPHKPSVAAPAEHRKAT